MKYYLTRYDAVFGNGELDIWREDRRQYTRVKRMSGKEVPPHGFVISNGMIKRCTIAESDSVEELEGIAVIESLTPPEPKITRVVEQRSTPKSYMRQYIHVDEV